LFPNVKILEGGKMHSLASSAATTYKYSPDVDVGIEGLKAYDLDEEVQGGCQTFYL
jgi:hypothetical protein